MSATDSGFALPLQAVSLHSARYHKGITEHCELMADFEQFSSVTVNTPAVRHQRKFIF